MKSTLLPRLVLTFVFACLSPHALSAAAPSATGTIEGRILNPRSGTATEGARVSVEGTTLVTFSDADGVYRLADVPAGNVRLRVFYTGFNPQLEPATIEAGRVTTRDITLTAPGGPAGCREGDVPGGDASGLDGRGFQLGIESGVEHAEAHIPGGHVGETVDAVGVGEGDERRALDAHARSLGRGAAPRIQDASLDGPGRAGRGGGERVR